MSKKKRQPKQRPTAARSTTASTPTTPRQRASRAKASPADMVFGRENYTYMIAGLALIVVGMILMSGGEMPSPDVWDESRIYSPVRITIAPMVILAGLGLNIYAIFKKAKPSVEATTTDEA